MPIKKNENIKDLTRRLIYEQIGKETGARTTREGDNALEYRREGLSDSKIRTQLERDRRRGK